MASETRRVGAVGVMAEQMTIRSGRGVVAAAAPLAARHAAAALDAGGNVYDAVLTAVLAEAVLLPPKCGPAGDLIALVWEAGSDEPEALLAIGGAPAGLSERIHDLRPTGPLSVGVPGAPVGYAALAARSRLGVDRAASVAEGIATAGFPWATVCAVLTEESLDLLVEHQPDGCVYLPGGSPITPGTLVQLPGLGRAVGELARTGADWIHGEIAAAVIDRVGAAGGILTLSDLQFSRAEWSNTPRTSLDGAPVFVTPAPTHGASLLDALDGLDLSGGEVGVHRTVMAAIARSRESLADPSGTSMVSAVDADGNAAVVVHSNSFPQFGSGVIVDDFQLVLSNRAGRGFSTIEGHPNSPQAGRRPATTLHAWAFRAPDGSRVLGATPGGANQMPWNAQTLARLARDGWALPRTAIGEAVCGPRWQWNPGDDSLTVEHGFDREELAQLGEVADVNVVDRWALRSAMQIVSVSGSGSELVATATSDPRTQSASLPI